MRPGDATTLAHSTRRCGVRGTTLDPCFNGINALSTLKPLSWIEGAQRGSDIELIELMHGPSTSILLKAWRWTWT
jgi:hypothetical protein